jgi:hypothetical protein
MATLDLSWRSFAHTHNELKKAELLGRPSADGAVTQNLGALVAGLLWFKQPSPETNKMVEERQTVELKRGKLSVDTSRRKATAELSQLLVGVHGLANKQTAAILWLIQHLVVLAEPGCCPDPSAAPPGAAKECKRAPSQPAAQRRRDTAGKASVVWPASPPANMPHSNSYWAVICGSSKTVQACLTYLHKTC